MPVTKNKCEIHQSREESGKERICSVTYYLNTEQYRNSEFERSKPLCIAKAMILLVLAERGKSNGGMPFKDEVNSKLLHSGRDVISIANSGLVKNGSQFVIEYKSQNYLNLKLTVFGGFVGGMMMLKAMEKFLVDDDDQPMGEVNVTEVTVFVNPSTEPDKEEENENAKEGETAVDKDNMDDMGFPVICS